MESAATRAREEAQAFLSMMNFRRMEVVGGLEEAIEAIRNQLQELQPAMPKFSPVVRTFLLADPREGSFS